MSYNSKILSDVLQARSITRAQLSERLGLKLSTLEGELQREPAPKQGILSSIARELALPAFVFYMKKAPPLHDVLPDFRSATPAPSAKSRETIEAIQLAEGIQRAAIEYAATPSSNLLRFEAATLEEIDTFALLARKHFGVTLDEQREAKDANAFYYLCRKKIEDKGIFVLHQSFPSEDGSGFCLSDPAYPIIVVNTKKQTRGRRLFTLVHELAHILMGQSGISDPFTHSNVIEKRCNRFASSFLMPREYLETLLGGGISRDPTVEEVAWAARRFKVSQEATILRLEQLGWVNGGSHAKWKQHFHNLGNPDYTEKGGGGGKAPPQEKVKLAQYGFRLANAFSGLLARGLANDIDVYRLTGLKPKYQKIYFDYANSLTATQLKSLDVDDE